MEGKHSSENKWKGDERSKFVHLGSVVETNGKIQNELERLQNFIIYLRVYYGIKI
jgi:hypothetical protein